MDYEISIDTQAGLIDWRVGGKVTAEGLNGSYDAVLDHSGYSPEQNMLIVVRRDARLGDLDFLALRRFQLHMQTRRAAIDSDARIKVALVFERSEHMPMVELHALSYSPHARGELRAFPSESEARAWLRG